MDNLDAFIEFMMANNMLDNNFGLKEDEKEDSKIKKLVIQDNKQKEGNKNEYSK